MSKENLTNTSAKEKADNTSSTTVKKNVRYRPKTKKTDSVKEQKTEAVTTNQNEPKPRQPKKTQQQRKTPIKIIPLGGLNEIGKNFTCFECSNDIFIVDCGLAFPDSEMPGVDIVIPDFTYVEKNKDKIRGIIITHGHEDHIGGIPYLLKKVNVPIYGVITSYSIHYTKLYDSLLFQPSHSIVLLKKAI